MMASSTDNTTFSTPTKRRLQLQERSPTKATYKAIEARRVELYEKERASRKRSPPMQLGSSKNRKRLRLDPSVASPIKVRVKRTPHNMGVVNLKALWDQNIISCLSKIVHIPPGCEDECYGESVGLSRLAPIYGELVLAFGALEVMLGGAVGLGGSIHDVISSEEERASLVDEGRWLPKDKAAFDLWVDYVTRLSTRCNVDIIADEFVHSTVFTLARIQRSTINFLVTTRAMELEKISPVSSYM